MQHKEFYLVYFSEFVARFCTWTILSQLLIYLINTHWEETPSQQLYLVGASLSLLFISALFGGLIRDWLFVEKVVVILGMGLVAIGGLLLLASSHFFYAGLGLTLLGTGMVTTNTPLLLSSTVNAEREKLFTVLYAAINSGVILGSILGGVMNQYFSWKGVILLNESMIILWLIYCAFSSWLLVLINLNKLKLLKFVIVSTAVAFIAYFYLKVEIVSEILLSLAGILYIIFLVNLIIKQQGVRKSLIFSIFLILLAIVFFSGEFQVASTLADYANNFVELTIAQIKIPAGSLMALESIFVVLGAFFIARLKLATIITNIQTKVFIGLFLGTLAFILLYGSTLIASHHLISVWWIVLAFLLFGLGDVSLMPPIMAYVTKTAPTHYKGLLMAGLYFSLSLSGYFSGLIGSILSNHFVKSNSNLHFYSTGFIVMIVILGIATGVILISRLVNVDPKN